MARLRGWEKRLIFGMQDYLAQPFHWRDSNCGHGIVTAIRAAYGEGHPIIQYLDQCKDEASTNAMLEHEGGLENIVGRYFELLVSPLFAQDGDIGIIKGIGPEGKPAQVGCVFLDGKAVGKRDSGIFRIPPTKVAMAFRV